MATIEVVVAYLNRFVLLLILSIPVLVLALVVVGAGTLGDTPRLARAGAVIAVVAIGFACCRLSAHLYRRRLRRDHLFDVLPLSGKATEADIEHTGTMGSDEHGRAAEPRAWNPRHSLAQNAVKRALDLVVVLGLLVVLGPSLLIIALAVKIGDRGPVMFRQLRIGRNGTTFTMRKFRTMVIDAESHPLPSVDASGRPLGPLFNIEHDPRVTAFGRILRRTGLDELPQLFNVATGDMSLVGPRPALPDEVASFDDELRQRELVRPGITGLWQALARDNPSLEVYQRLDLYYVNNASLHADVAILSWTLARVLARAGRCIFSKPSEAR